MIRSLVIAPDKRLNQVSKKVDIIDDNIRELITDMFETMYHNKGIGLAAVQVGELVRVLVMDVEQLDNSQSQLCLINPVITYKSNDLYDFTEGCLSFPSAYQTVSRPKTIDVEYQDTNGEKRKLSRIDGLLAVCVQHEIDHLNGITIPDHIQDKIENQLFWQNYHNKRQS